jgi:hypothetical protein
MEPKKRKKLTPHNPQSTPYYTHHANVAYVFQKANSKSPFRFLIDKWAIFCALSCSWPFQKDRLMVKEKLNSKCQIFPSSLESFNFSPKNILLYFFRKKKTTLSEPNAFSLANFVRKKLTKSTIFSWVIFYVPDSKFKVHF